MGIFKPKKNYADIGKQASADEFLTEARKLAQSGTWSDAEKLRKLIDGAMQAFSEGRPENIQTALLNADVLKNYYRCSAHGILFELSEKSDEKLADINLALAKIPEEDRKNYLSKRLHSAINSGIGDEAFFSSLLQAGADANATIEGYEGAILASAVRNNHPISVIKLLHDNGASFKDALTTMYSKSDDANDKDTLRHYQQELEGKPAVAGEPVAMAEVMRQMMEQVGEITERVSELTEEIKNLKSRIPAPETAGTQAARPLRLR